MGPLGWMNLAQAGQTVLDGAMDYWAAKKWEEKFKEDLKDQNDYATSAGETASIRSAALHAAQQWDPNSSVGSLAAQGLYNLFKQPKDRDEIDPTPAVINTMEALGRQGLPRFFNRLSNKPKEEVPEVEVNVPEKDSETNNDALANVQNQSFRQDNDGSLVSYWNKTQRKDPFSISLINNPNISPIASSYTKLNPITGSTPINKPVMTTSNSSNTNQTLDFTKPFKSEVRPWGILGSDISFGKLGLKLKLIPK